MVQYILHCIVTIVSCANFQLLCCLSDCFTKNCIYIDEQDLSLYAPVRVNYCAIIFSD